MFRSSNPILNAKVFSQSRSYGDSQSMTIQGTVNKTYMLLFLLMATAWWSWNQIMASVAPVDMFSEAVARPSTILMPMLIVSGIAGFILAIVTTFNPSVSRITAPLYALCEGVVIGSISAFFETQQPGIVLQAVTLTFGVLFLMLSLYKSQIIKVTEKFKMGLFAAMGGIMVIYLANFVMSFFGSGIPMMYSSSPMGIGFSLIVVAIAALNLVMDFDLIDRAAQSNAPKYMEWYCSFALMVTLIWLYIEILKLLSKINRRR